MKLKPFDSEESNEAVDEVEGHRKGLMGPMDTEESDEVEGHKMGRAY